MSGPFSSHHGRWSAEHASDEQSQTRHISLVKVTIGQWKGQNKWTLFSSLNRATQKRRSEDPAAAESIVDLEIKKNPIHSQDACFTSTISSSIFGNHSPYELILWLKLVPFKIPSFLSSCIAHRFPHSLTNASIIHDQIHLSHSLPWIPYNSGGREGHRCCCRVGLQLR